ncbi:entericidin A/B family lipoprotein [Marinivivus vitaminiproducens]|uniref:entericidin A/B family lipoprotein n=1 Tax=Marinivivus vitaminiproducens TaxID=3035935 RepID=UPI0027A045B3|nr:entericidin A/B family lipoprotein [Geminicoccaceae bacterium SCSIO 64248]
MTDHSTGVTTEKRRALTPFLALALLLGTLALGACNTMEGAGDDLSAAGDAMSDSAEDNKGY